MSISIDMTRQQEAYPSVANDSNAGRRARYRWSLYWEPNVVFVPRLEGGGRHISDITTKIDGWYLAGWSKLRDKNNPHWPPFVNWSVQLIGWLGSRGLQVTVSQIYSPRRIKFRSGVAVFSTPLYGMRAVRYRTIVRNSTKQYDPYPWIAPDHPEWQRMINEALAEELKLYA